MPKQALHCFRLFQCFVSVIFQFHLRMCECDKLYVLHAADPVLHQNYNNRIQKNCNAHIECLSVGRIGGAGGHCLLVHGIEH